MTEPIGDPSVVTEWLHVIQVSLGPAAAAIAGHSSRWAKQVAAGGPPPSWRGLIAGATISGLFGLSAAAVGEYFHLPATVTYALAGIAGHMGLPAMISLGFRVAQIWRGAGGTAK